VKHSSSELLDPGGAAGNSRPTTLIREALPFLPLAAESQQPLLAIDLGQALESLELLDLGWTVLALTEKPTSSRRRSVRLTVEVVDFRSLVLPRADLVYTGSMLSKRPAPDLVPVWSRIVPAVRPGGWFVGHFLGDRHGRAPDPRLTFLTRKQVVTLLSGFLVELLRERENASDHRFDVIARRRGAGPTG
jgi:hypothetical protein